MVGSAGDVSRVWSMIATSSSVSPTLRPKAASASPRRTRVAGFTARSRISRISASALRPCWVASTRSARCTQSGTFPLCGPPIWRDPRQVSIDLPSPLQQVVVSLEAKPEPLRDSEIPRQPQVRIRGDRSFAEHDLVDPPRRHPDRSRETILCQTHRLDGTHFTDRVPQPRTQHLFALFASNPCFVATHKEGHNANNAKGRKQRKQSAIPDGHSAHFTAQGRPGAPPAAAGRSS